MGIRAEYIEVLVTKKPHAVAESDNSAIDSSETSTVVDFKQAA